MLSPRAAAFGVEALLRNSEVSTTPRASESTVDVKTLNSFKTKDEEISVKCPKVLEQCDSGKPATVTKPLQSEENLKIGASYPECLKCSSDQCSKKYSEYLGNDITEKAPCVSAEYEERRDIHSFPLQQFSHPHQEYLQYQFSQRYNLQSTTPFTTLYLGVTETTENEAKANHPYLLSEQQQQQQQLQKKQQQEQRLSTQNGVTVELQHAALWDEFHRHQTEMIITKNGRRMFPVIKIRVFGLNPDSLYMMYLDMVPVDGKRYRYAYPSSSWVASGSGDAPSGSEQVYIHTDSPATGRQWMDMLIISFDKLKLTNNRNRDTKGQIFLQSMQKYKPKIWIQCLQKPKENSRGSKSTSSSFDLQKLVDREASSQFSFRETSFITVTAYQNQRITRLKINSNPFAKGFRDNYKYKETIEKHMMTSVSCGLHCQRTSYFPFSSPLSSYFLQNPFSLNPLLPLAPSSHLRPAATSLNRWSAINPSGNPSDVIIPALNPFFNTSFQQ